MSDPQELIDQIKQEVDFFKKAKLILQLKREKQTPIFKLSQELGLKPSYVSHILRLNKLPLMIIDGYYSNSISISHLFIISRLEKEEDMIEVYEKALGESLTALQIEELVRQKLYNIKNEGTHLGNTEIEDIVNFLSDFGIEAKIIQSRVKGKVILEIKGNLENTSQKIREIIKLLKSKVAQSPNG